MAEITLLTLPDELILQILEEVGIMHLQFLRACSELNHRFYRLCVPLIYRSTRFRFNRTDGDIAPTPLYTSFIRNNSRVPSYITSISLSKCSDARESPELLVKFLKMAERLRSVHVRGTSEFSRAIWRTLNTYCPNVVLDMDVLFVHPGPGVPHTNQRENNADSEIKTSRLRRLWVRLGSGYSHDRIGKRVVIDFLQRTIRSSPQIREIIVTHGQLSPASERREFWPGEMMIDPCERPGDPLPPIEVLEWLDFTPRSFYEWTANDGWRSLKKLSIYYQEDSGWWSGECVETPSLETLIIQAHMDIDKLDRPPYIKGPVKEVILLCNGNRDPPSQFLGLYKDTLERLIVDPHSAVANNSHVISLPSIMLLAQNCPKLTKLALCPYAFRELPYSFFAQIATAMKSVTQLDILGYRGSRWGDVEMDANVMRHLFDFMTANNLGSRFEKLSMGYMVTTDQHSFHTSLSAELMPSGEVVCRNVYENSVHRHPYGALAKKVRQDMDEDNQKRRMYAPEAYLERQTTFETKHGKDWILFDVLYPRRKGSFVEGQAVGIDPDR